MSMRRFPLVLPALVLAAVPMQAEQVAPVVAAKIIRISLGNGQPRIAGVQGELASELKKLGVVVDPEAPCAWASCEADVRNLVRKGKFVICGSSDWFGAGAALALVPEGGRPTLLLHGANARRSGMELPDSVKRLAKAVN